MRISLRLAGLGLSLAVAAAMPIQAQEQYSTALKLRVGSVYGPITKYTLGHRTQGFGVEVARNLAAGQVFAEATYDTFTGYRKDVTQLGGTAWYAGDGTQDPMNPSAPSTTYQGHPLTTQPDTSLYGEMLEYQGFGLRLGYRAPLTWSWMEGWDWQAGLSVDRRETRHEVIMTLTPGWYDASGSFNQIMPTVSRLDTTYYESARFTNVTYNMEYGAFAGLSHAFNEMFHTEINARYTTFKTPHYEPFTYTGQIPHITDTTRGGFVLEVAIGVKL